MALAQAAPEAAVRLLLEREQQRRRADGGAHSFASFCHEYLFAPLGMNDTAWFRDDLPADTHQAVMTQKSGSGVPPAWAAARRTGGARASAPRWAWARAAPAQMAAPRSQPQHRLLFPGSQGAPSDGVDRHTLHSVWGS